MRISTQIGMAVILCAASVASGEPLTQGERDRALSELYASRKLFLDSIAGLSAAQWKFKPAADRWSVAECAEHIALSEDFLFKMVTDKVMKSPEIKPNRAEARKADVKILEGVADRSKKAQAPEPLKPATAIGTPQAVSARFDASRNVTLDYIRSTPDDLRAHQAQAGSGPMDAYQWILLIAAHTNRHVAQINEVKASAGFPK